MIVTDGTIMRDPPIPNTSAAGWRYGTADNNLTVSLGGVISLAGSAKRSLRTRPDLDYSVITAQGKPTQVSIGPYVGYSLPIYNSDNEELFVKTTLPRRWDGASNFSVIVTCAISAAEDAGDKFQIRVNWASKSGSSGVVPSSGTDVDVTQAVLAGRTAQYSIYELTFAIDWDLPAVDAAANDTFAAVVRRIAAASPQVSNEIIILGVDVQFTVDKMYSG